MRIRIGNININNIKPSSEIIDDLLLIWKKIAANNGTNATVAEWENIKSTLLSIPEQDVKWLYDNSDAIYSQYINTGTVPSGVYEISKQSLVLENLFTKILFPIEDV